MTSDERLWHRMWGSFWLLNAAGCHAEGLKYPDLSALRLYNIGCTLFFVWLMYRQWKKELR